MKILGITGGIGSGKSTVLNILNSLGATVVDADSIAKELINTSTDILKELQTAFGSEIISNQGELDRKKIADIVFNDSEKLKLLNGITHTHIGKKIKEILQTYNKETFVALEASIPLKHGFIDVADEIWVVVANEETRIERIMKRNAFTREEAIKRIKSQQVYDYIKFADTIIYNDSSYNEIEKEVSIKLKDFLNKTT